MYMIGGFNKMRVKLDSMVKFNLNTGQQVECASLPVTVFKVGKYCVQCTPPSVVFCPLLKI